MQTATATAIDRGIHMIESSAGVEVARQLMEAMGVAWLGVCQADTLVGTIDAEQLRHVPQDDDRTVGDLATDGDGRVHWVR